MGKIIAEVTVVPLGTGTTSLSRYVAETEKVLNKFPDLKKKLTPMSTIIEGEMALVLNAITEMHEIPFRMGAKRVSTRITIDDRRDQDATMEKKISSVETKM